MDGLEPELQELYDKCKYTVKVWEYKFKKKYKRVPSKLDIKEASNEVRYAYKKYFELKTSILEQSFKGIDGFDDDDYNEVENESELRKETLQSQEACEVTQGPKESSESYNVSKEKSDSIEKTEITEKVWGVHLNNQKIEKKTEKETSAVQQNLNLNISQKLFCGSKFSKRNPRKSLSFTQKNKTESSSFSQTSPKFSSFTSEEALNLLADVSNTGFTTVPHMKASLSQPVNLVQSFSSDAHFRPLKSVDEGWLSRVEKTTGTLTGNPELLSSKSCIVDNKKSESTKLDYNSDDIIEDSDDESCFNNTQTVHIAKKKRIENNSEIINQSILNIKSNDNIESSTLNIKPIQVVNKDLIVVKEDKNTSDFINDNDSIIETNAKENIQIESKECNEISKNSVTKTKKLKKSPKKKQIIKTPEKNTQEISPRRSTRKNKVKVSLQELSSGEEDPFCADEDKDPDFSLGGDEKSTLNYFCDLDSVDEPRDEKKNSKESKPKLQKSKTSPSNKKRGKKLKENKDKDEEEQPGTYDLEFSVKPRIVAPRYGSIKEVLKKNKKKPAKENEESKKDPGLKDVIKTKRQQDKEKLEKKISSGSLNDNFVQINIKKKIFVRGKKGMNFAKYKKSQWKKAKALAGPDMDMGGCDGGMLTCFNCGQVGHFAQRCPSKKGDGLLPLDAVEGAEEECPFPTLEEASKMAESSNLNIRTPKVALKEIPNSNNDDDDDDNKEMNEYDELLDEDSELLLLETIKLEEHIKKLDVQSYMDNITVVEPYYKLKEDNTIIDTPEEVFETLQKFGHSAFRPGQEQAIMRILSGKSTLVTLSTGSGKSLCYQLPAYLYSKREPCISLIISPLVSLMDDQILGIAKFIKAACLHSNQTQSQRKKILEAISMGELSILLVSPEAVVSGEKQKGFNSFLRKLPPIAFACIDEAHCVSQWSHNFRPSYLMICRVLRDSLGVKTILGLTATATKATQNSIITHLQITDGDQGVISDTPLPDNLKLSVSKDGNRDHALLSLLLSDRFKDCSSIIIYCTRRQECERIAAYLRTSLKSEKPAEADNKKRKRLNLQAEPYHAGLSASRRKSIQNTFMSGALRIVVATVAFGMGINKSDIRAVIHYNMPSSFESYVQEVGRAGRDGLDAECHVFLDSMGRDECELRRHIHANSIDRHVIRKLLEKVFVPCTCKAICLKHEVAFSIESTVRALDIPEENISTLLCYLELHENRYIELLSPAYTKCKIFSYGGPLQIRKMAKECPPLAMALALYKNEGKDDNIFEFPVVDVAAAMGWESGICKHKLKNLEWITVNNQQKRSTLTVQFFDLGFRMLAPGNLSDDQLDETLDNIYNRTVEQEKTALLQLNAIHHTLSQAAATSFHSCFSLESDSIIKSKVREYFNSPNPLELVPPIVFPKYNEEQIVSDIRALIFMYRDNKFNGRAIARIFQGIQSPNYPAVIWGRCKFWRSHLDKDFHAIVKIATREIIKLR